MTTKNLSEFEKELLQNWKLTLPRDLTIKNKIKTSIKRNNTETNYTIGELEYCKNIEFLFNSKNKRKLKSIKKPEEFTHWTVGKRSKNSYLILINKEKEDVPKIITQYLAFYNGSKRNLEKKFRHDLLAGKLCPHLLWEIHLDRNLSFLDIQKEMSFNPSKYLLRSIGIEIFMSKTERLEEMLKGYNRQHKEKKINFETKIIYGKSPPDLLFGGQSKCTPLQTKIAYGE